MESRLTRQRVRRGLAGRLVILALVAAWVLPAVAGGQQKSAGVPVRLSPRPAMYVLGGANATQVTAHDGTFWAGSQQIKLRGVNIVPAWDGSSPTDDDFAKIASWGMNFVRLQVRWRFAETVPPLKVGNTWIHTYSASFIDSLKSEIGWAYNHGLYVLVDNAGHSGPPPIPLTGSWPDWLYLPLYNSHQKTYLGTMVDEANTDYWTDSLQQQFTADYLKYLAGQLANTPGIVGYEVINEPQRGNLPNTRATTALMMGVSLTLGRAVRQADPARVVFFMTRGCCGEGTPQADYSGFVGLGNVAQDVHDYLGARWGEGLMMDRTNPEYGETLQMVDRFALDTGPYLGTTTGQVRFVQNYTSVLTPKGIPLLMGEFSADPPYEQNEANLMGSMTSAFNDQGVSWTLYSYDDAQFSMFNTDGTLKPWAQIVIDAAKAP